MGLLYLDPEPEENQNGTSIFSFKLRDKKIDKSVVPGISYLYKGLGREGGRLVPGISYLYKGLGREGGKLGSKKINKRTF